MRRFARAGTIVRVAAVLGTIVMVAAACGSRVPHDEALAVATGGGAAGGGFGDDRAGGTLAADDWAPGSTPDEESSRPGEESSPTGSQDGVAVPGAEPDSTVDNGTQAVDEPLEGAGAPQATGQQVPGQSGRGEQAPGAPLQPIRIGMIGSFSGILGSIFGPPRDAYRAWASMVNERGGINGHPVELLVADDGGDAARTMAIARDFVENRRVIAFVNLWPAPGGMDGVAKYAEEKNVPVVGGATFEQAFHKSPMLFPQSSSLRNAVFALAKITHGVGISRIAIVYCTEVAACEQATSEYRGHAESMGMKVVYQQGTSLAQPDFTAECLNAERAGAELVVGFTDANSVNRLARSCARQNYRPRYLSSNTSEEVAPELEGAFTGTFNVPWVLTSGSPALQEYGDAMRRYASNASRNHYTGSGWAAGKLFELAAAKVSDPPTSKDILEGLWAMQGETLNGLAPPLTFVRGKPAPEANCAFYVEVKGGKWAAPRGLELVGCR